MKIRSVLLHATNLALVLTAGCSQTEECKQLEVILKARQGILNTARAQAGAVEVVEKRALAAEGNANKLMRALWLSEPETKINETLEKRAKAISGATIERTTTPVSLDRPDEPPISETMWIVRFKEASVDRAFLQLNLLINNPPLLKFSAIIRDKSTNEWRVEIIRAAVDQVPINPQPAVIPAPEDLGKIPKQIGFCGAGKLRDDIYKIDFEIRSLVERAQKTSVLLPASASWEGLRLRAELIRDVELETRRHVELLRDAVQAAGIPIKGIGVEGAMVFLEAWGGPKDLNKLEQEIVKRGGGDQLQKPKTAPEGVIRVMLPNTVEETRRMRGRGSMRISPNPGKGPAPGEEAPAEGTP